MKTRRILTLVLAVAAILIAQKLGLYPTSEKDPSGSDTATTEDPAVRAEGRESATEPLERPDTSGREGADAADRIVAAFRSQRSGTMFQVPGTVKKTLTDDLEGSRHQRFILELSNGHTVLVAHNIDLAQRVPLSAGDEVELNAQYEWNEQGGVLHWTHHDPRGKHEGGWIRHAGTKYE